MIVTGGYDCLVRIWDVETFKAQQAFTTNYIVEQVLFTKTNLLIALSDLTIYIWDKCAGKLLKAIPTSSPCFGFSTKHNQLIATQGEELTLLSVPLHPTGDWISSTALSIGKDSISGVKTMSVSPDGELMAYTMDTRIYIWNIESKKIHRLFDEHTSGINGLAWRGSKYLASASKDKTVRIWATGNDNEESSEEVQVANSLCVLAGHSGEVTCVSFSSDGSRLASGSHDLTIRIWILKESDQTRYELWKVLFGHSASIYSLDFDPCGQQLISSSNDKTVRVWAISTLEKADADQEEPRQPPNPSPLKGHSLPIILIVFSPDGRLFASASYDGKICLWDCVEGNLIGSFEEHKIHPTSLSFSDSGKILVSACKDNTARVWDTDSMTIKHRLWGHNDWVNYAVVSPNETLVATASGDKSVRVWELSSLPAARAENNYSVDTKHRRFGGDDGHEDWVSTVTFSKGGYLASGDDDSKILIWNLQGTGDQTKPDISLDNASKKSIRGLCFTEDEKRIASCDAGGVIKILNLETKVCEHILVSEGKPQIFNSINFIKSHPNLLMTDLGVWKIPKKAIPPSVSACKPEGPVKTALSRKSAPDWCPYGIKHNQEWITWKNKDLIFLPAQFRPSEYEEAACCIQGRKVAIGCDSGQVLFFRFSDKGPYLPRSDSL